MSTPGFGVSIHSSLTMPLLLAGAPRQFSIVNATMAAAFTFGLQTLYVLPICGVAQVVAVMLAKRDPYFFQIMLRHIKQKNYYQV